MKTPIYDTIKKVADDFFEKYLATETTSTSTSTSMFKFNLYLEHDFWMQFLYEVQFFSRDFATNFYDDKDILNIEIEMNPSVKFNVKQMLQENFYEKNNWPTEAFEKEVFKKFMLTNNG